MRCSHAGTLTRSASVVKIYLAPDSPYGTACYNVLAKDMNALNVESICDHISQWRPTSPHKYAHGFKDLVSVKLAEVNSGSVDLNLMNTKRRKSARRQLHRRYRMVISGFWIGGMSKVYTILDFRSDHDFLEMHIEALLRRGLGTSDPGDRPIAIGIVCKPSAWDRFCR
ncbi:hypothetical protein BDZ45DRAFT_475434 [Acephala macrosclerotiorum]|nr:hypothetical protein BDZ45DRAFT_475434 [Acephala macrosclerotiorum]